MTKLSIIVPIYNVEKYIERCLLSILSQLKENGEVELILVNDGSTDSSAEIAKKIISDNTDVIYVDQTNCGLSVTRNLGLALAKGKYVWFVDSDDWIEEGAIDKILSQPLECDAFAIGHNLFCEGSSKVIIKNVFPSGINDGRSLLMLGFYEFPVQFYAMRREFLLENDLNFYEGIKHEDFEFTPRMLFNATKVKTIEGCLYNFWKRSGSITSSNDYGRSIDLIKVVESLRKFEKKNVQTEFKYLFHNLYWLAINNGIHNCTRLNKAYCEEYSKLLYTHLDLIKDINKTSVLKYQIERSLFILFPKRMVEVYNFIQLFNRRAMS